MCRFQTKSKNQRWGTICILWEEEKMKHEMERRTWMLLKQRECQKADKKWRKLKAFTRGFVVQMFESINQLKKQHYEQNNLTR